MAKTKGGKGKKEPRPELPTLTINPDSILLKKYGDIYQIPPTELIKPPYFVRQSYLKKLLVCLRSFHLEMLADAKVLERPVRLWSPVGDAFHKGVRLMNCGDTETQGRPVEEPEDAVEMAVAYFKSMEAKYPPDQAEYEDFRIRFACQPADQVAHLVRTYAKNWQGDLSDYHPEVLMKAEVSSRENDPDFSFLLKGQVDYVRFNKAENAIEIVDLKSANKRGLPRYRDAFVVHDPQALTYALLAVSGYGELYESRNPEVRFRFRAVCKESDEVAEVAGTLYRDATYPYMRDAVLAFREYLFHSGPRQVWGDFTGCQMCMSRKFCKEGPSRAEAAE